MSNIRIAFDRYLELQSAKRHAEMLRWCLDDVLPNYTASRIQKKSMLLPMNLKLSCKLSNIGVRNFGLWKRKFSVVSCQYFNSNYDVLVKRDTNRDQIVKIANQKLMNFTSMLKNNDNTKEHYDLSDLIMNMFEWFYSYGLFEHCYKVLSIIPKPRFRWFTHTDTKKVLYVIDNFGTQTDVVELFRAFPSSKSVKDLVVVTNLRKNEFLNILIGMLEDCKADNILKSFTNILRLSNSRTDSGTFMITLVLSYIIKNFCTKDQARALVKRVTQSDLPKAFYSGPLICVMYDFILEDEGLEEAIKWMKRIVNSHGVTYTDKGWIVFSALKHGDKRPLYSFLLWASLFKDVSLNYETVPSELLILKSRWLFSHKFDFSQLDNLRVSENEISRLVSILIYGHTLWGSKEEALKFYSYKESHILKLETSDRIGKLKCLAHLKRYSEVLEFLDGCIGEDANVMSSASYDVVFLSLAKLKKWNKLKDQFDSLYKKEQITTLREYSVMFMSLASRGATKYILNLWDTFTKRGYTPNETILASIIFGFIKTKSYTKALQWFSAYSYYHVPLGLKSYGLMLNALASTNDFASCFRLLDEMSSRNLKLTSLQMKPLLKQCALLGDTKGVIKVLKEYYPMFDIVITNNDMRWINWSHYYGNRFGTVIQNYYRRLKMHSAIDYKDTVLALESASKYSDPLKFWSLWKKLERNHEIMGIDAYIIYMNCYVRRFGLFNIDNELDKIQEVVRYKHFPIKIFNEMIFSSIRKGRPEYTPYILKMALNRGCIPSSKTYSLLLQSNCSSYRYSEGHIEETIQLLNEVLLNRRKDKLGKLNRDLNPMSFKLVMMHILKFKGVVTARKYFELYVESSKNYLLDNIHILNIELMLLGEEGRWEEFSGCYDRYILLLKSKMKYARFRSSSTTYSTRVKQFGYPLASSVNEFPIRISHSPSLRIPSSIKKAMFTVWPYRLRQLEYMEQLDDVNSNIKLLYKNGFMLSNNNLNDTALLMSKHYELIGDTVLFINRYLLPKHLKEIQYNYSKMRYRLGKFSRQRTPSIYIKKDVFFQIMDNFDNALSARLTPAQKDDLLDSVTFSGSFNILQSLRKVIASRNRLVLLSKFTRKIRERFYNIRHHSLINWKRYDAKLFVLNMLNKRIRYRSKEYYLRERRKEIIKDLTNENDAETRSQLSLKKDKVRKEFLELNRKKRSVLNSIREENSGLKKYNVGDFNLYKFSATRTSIDPTEKSEAVGSKPRNS